MTSRKRGLPEESPILSDVNLINETLERGHEWLSSAPERNWDDDAGAKRIGELRDLAEKILQLTLDMVTVTLSGVIDQEEGIFINIMEYACGRVEEWGYYNRVSKQWRKILKGAECQFLTGQLLLYPVGEYISPGVDFDCDTDDDAFYKGECFVVDGAFVRNIWKPSGYLSGSSFLLPWQKRATGPNAESMPSALVPMHPHLDVIMKSVLGFKRPHFRDAGDDCSPLVGFSIDGMFAFVVEECLYARADCPQDGTLVNMVDGTSTKILDHSNFTEREKEALRGKPGYGDIHYIWRVADNQDAMDYLGLMQKSEFPDGKRVLHCVQVGWGHSGLINGGPPKRWKLEDGMYVTHQFASSSPRYIWQTLTMPKAAASTVVGET